MILTLTFSWWHIPTAVTVLSILWAFYWPADRDGMFGGVTTMFMLIPALFITAISWLIAGIVK